jgi:hypothetical protein
MSRRADDLAHKRNALRATCATQRRQLAETAGAIKSKLGTVDRGIGFVGGLVRNPLVVVGAAALLIAVGPKRLLRLIGRGAVVATTARRIARIVR